MPIPREPRLREPIHSIHQLNCMERFLLVLEEGETLKEEHMKKRLGSPEKGFWLYLARKLNHQTNGARDTEQALLQWKEGLITMTEFTNLLIDAYMRQPREEKKEL